MSSCCDEKRKNIITAPYLWEKCLSLFVNKRFLILLASLISHKKGMQGLFQSFSWSRQHQWQISDFQCWVGRPYEGLWLFSAHIFARKMVFDCEFLSLITLEFKWFCFRNPNFSYCMASWHEGSTCQLKGTQCIKCKWRGHLAKVCCGEKSQKKKTGKGTDSGMQEGK